MVNHSDQPCLVPLVQLQNISVRFEGVKALDGVEFSLEAGEIHCLAGENGSGKSTLIKVMTGVYKPTPDGKILVEGEHVDEMTPLEARAVKIGTIWQDLALFPHMTVYENIAITQILGNNPKIVNLKNLRSIAHDALSKLGVDIPLEEKVGSLPISQRQLVAIARALAQDCRVLIMDEANASLTHAETLKLTEIVRRLSERGISIVFVSHRLAEVLEISHRVTVLRDGRLVGVFPTQGMTQSRLSELMTGRTFANQSPRVRRANTEVVLQVVGCSRRGEFDDVCLSLQRGEILGFTGLLGAGRTELALTLFGMKRPDSGKLLLNGKRLRLRSNIEAISSGIAYLSEDRLQLGLVQEQSIASNIVAASLKSAMLGPFLSGRTLADIVSSWVRELKIKIGNAEDAINTLSGGNQQRAAIAKWLATNPQVLILDAPTVGVDVGARASIFRIVANLAKSGMSIIIISDEVPEVYFNCDRVLHFSSGKIKGEYFPQDCTVSDLERAVYG